MNQTSDQSPQRAFCLNMSFCILLMGKILLLEMLRICLVFFLCGRRENSSQFCPPVPKVSSFPTHCLWLVSIHYCSRVITVANEISRSCQSLLSSVPTVVSMTFTADCSRTKLKQQWSFENLGILKIWVYKRRDFCQVAWQILQVRFCHQSSGWN